jgi:hypothetical protein
MTVEKAGDDVKRDTLKRNGMCMEMIHSEDECEFPAKRANGNRQNPVATLGAVDHP